MPTHPYGATNIHITETFSRYQLCRLQQQETIFSSALSQCFMCFYEHTFLHVQTLNTCLTNSSADWSFLGVQVVMVRKCPVDVILHSQRRPILGASSGWKYFFIFWYQLHGSSLSFKIFVFIFAAFFLLFLPFFSPSCLSDTRTSTWHSEQEWMDRKCVVFIHGTNRMVTAHASSALQRCHQTMSLQRTTCTETSSFSIPLRCSTFPQCNWLLAVMKMSQK